MMDDNREGYPSYWTGSKAQVGQERRTSGKYRPHLRYGK
ncbi:hypothetical protein TIFTF001_051874 [Ficus carica]|uniref:Uncharacterized protein n=1 Tax=Ficus carica TaxID=3494 RepID=A0AA88EBM0_FICCA|nr:hypothetical protein TIFTF001_051874 [Ficus carica]